MRQVLVEVTNAHVYIVNIPEVASEGSISTENAVILKLWERLQRYEKYVEELEALPQNTVIQINGKRSLFLNGRQRKLLTNEHDDLVD